MANAKTDDKVMALVEQELKKKPGATVDELYEKATKVEKSVSKLTKRQFNARYPLQVKRRMGGMSKRSKPRAGAKKKATKGTKAEASGADAGAGRDAVRATFMRFASDMASAEQRKDLVRFLAGVDSYVDEVLKAAG
ncbi:MAG: hypothetical protein PVI57_17435 [Gemmatimonadota bacterium]